MFGPGAQGASWGKHRGLLAPEVSTRLHEAISFVVGAAPAAGRGPLPSTGLRGTEVERTERPVTLSLQRTRYDGPARCSPYSQCSQCFRSSAFHPTRRVAVDSRPRPNPPKGRSAAKRPERRTHRVSSTSLAGRLLCHCNAVCVAPGPIHLNLKKPLGRSTLDLCAARRPTGTPDKPPRFVHGTRRLCPAKFERLDSGSASGTPGQRHAWLRGAP